MTGARLNLNNPTATLYGIRFPNGEFYVDRDNVNLWPINAAKSIARNVAKKRDLTVTIVKAENPVDRDSPYDRILFFVNELKGKALRLELSVHNLPYGHDSAYSKRERLIAHLLKCKEDHN